MKALLIIDMQAGMLAGGDAPYRLGAVISHINAIARAIRARSGPVIFIQHYGAQGSGFCKGEPGWHLLPEMERAESDDIVPKTICDSFYETGLDFLLRQYVVSELIITGWATDFCVDTTLRSAISHGYSITVPADAHTLADRPHLDAVQLIHHHNQTWNELLVPPGQTLSVTDTRALLQQLN